MNPAPVGASLLAMDDNDNAEFMEMRGVHTFIASKRSPARGLA
jgi:hypothetical protein